MSSIKRKEKFSIRKFSVGAASILIGASLLMSIPHQSPITVKAMEKIEAVATNQEVSLSVIAQDGGAKVAITALKDITNTEVKVTLDGNKVKTYRIDKLKAGEKIIKEITKAELDMVKSQLKVGQKTLPNTAVVRKNIEKSIILEGNTLKVAVGYDVEEIKQDESTKPTNSLKPTDKPNKPGNEVKPTEPTKPVVPTKPTKPEKTVEPTKPTEPAKPVVPPKPTDKPNKPGNEVKPPESSKEKKEEIEKIKNQLKEVEVSLETAKDEVKKVNTELLKAQQDLEKAEEEAKEIIAKYPDDKELGEKLAKEHVAPYKQKLQEVTEKSVEVKAKLSEVEKESSELKNTLDKLLKEQTEAKEPTEENKEKPVYEKEIGKTVTLSEDKKQATFADNDGDTPVKVSIPTEGLEKEVARLEVVETEVPNIDKENNKIYDIHFVTESGEEKQIKQSAKVEIPVEKTVVEAYHIEKDGTNKQPLNFLNKEVNNTKYVEIMADHFSLVGIRYEEEKRDEKQDEVVIKDPLLKKLINKNIDINRSDDQKITKEELAKLTKLDIKDNKDKPLLESKSLKDTDDFKFILSYGIKDISGLENATNLTELNLGENEIVDITPLTKLDKLTKLSLIRNRITNLEPLSGLTNLEYLDLYANKLTDISPLKTLVNLKHLDLHNNNDQTGDPKHPTVSGGIEDISAVKNMAKLELLSLGSNNIKDISVIKNLKNIKDLVLSGNHISDYSGLGEYIAQLLSKQNEGEGSVSFAGQRLNYDKEIVVENNKVTLDNPFKGIKELGVELAKIFESDEPVNLFQEVTTNTEGVTATYNSETEKFELSFTDKFLEENKNKVVPINIRAQLEDYAWSINNVKLKVSKLKEEKTAVVFKDANLKATLLKKLKEYNGQDIKEEDIAGEYNLKIKDKSYRKDKNDTEIYENDLEQLEAFAIRGYDDEYNELTGDNQIKDLTGLEKAINLKQLTISGNSEDSSAALKDITPLSMLKKLELLRLSHNALSDVSKLSNLTNLKYLYLSHNNISNLDSLSFLNNLESFDVSKNKISSIDVVGNFSKLKTLAFRNNEVQNINELAKLKNLEWLDANANKIMDISSLSSLKNLKNLYLDNNKIENIDTVSELINLVELYVKNNNLTHINVEKLVNLVQLNLSENNLTDVSSINTLVKLKELYLAKNKLTKVQLEKLVDLDNLDLSHNMIKDFSSLSKLENTNISVENQKVDYNKEVKVNSKKIEIENPFEGLTKLVKDENITLSTGNSDIEATYNKNTNKIEFIFSDEMLDSGGKETIDLSYHYQAKGYDDEEKTILLTNISFNLEKEVFKDPVLIKKFKGKDLSKVTELDNLYGVKDLTGISKLTNLTRFEINGEYNDIRDISELANLTNLEVLSLENTKIKDISALSKLTKLRELNLAGPFADEEYSVVVNPEEYNIKNIDVLKNLTNLEVLSLANRGVEDISALAKLTKLNDIILSNNNINDISALKDLVELTNLDLTSNKNIEDIEILKGLTNLTNLWLTENKISDIVPLKDLVNLKKLYINVNKISNLAPLSKLTKLTHLSLGDNNIVDVSPLSTLTNLVSLRAADNKIVDVKALSTLIKLTDLNLSNNSIYDFSSLNSLEKINRKRGFAKELFDVDVTSRKFTLPVAKDFDGSIVPLDKNEDGSIKVYQVEFKKGKNQPKVNNETEELIPYEKQYNIVEKNGKYVLPSDIENGLYAVQWFKNYQQWGTFILNVNLQKEVEKDPTEAVELEAVAKVVYKNLLNEWSNFNKNYKNLTEEANKEYVDNKKPKVGTLPKKDNNFVVGDFLKLKTFSSNGELKVGSRAVDTPVTNEQTKALENAKNLEEFKVLAKKDGVRKITNWDFLEKLAKLKTFYYTNQNKTKERADLSNLDLTENKELKDVRVGQGNLTNLNFIKGLSLTNFDAEDNEISDTSALKGMTSLTELHLDNNKLSNENINDIAGLTNLKTLYLKNNKDVSDISKLETLKNLEAIELKHMGINDISVLKKLPNLRRLVVDGNPLAKDYINIIKELNINTGYLGEITKDDFEWLKNYAIREEVSATLNENKQREFTFTKLPITVEVKKSQIKDGKVVIENSLVDWDNMGAGRDYEKDLPADLEIADDDTTNITVNIGEETSKVIKYDINIEDYNHEFEGRPANIHGTVELTVKVVEDLTEKSRSV